jgi:hypothetical protein
MTGHTHGSGGGGGEIVLALLAVLAAAAIAGPVVAAVAELVHVLLVIAVVVLGLAAVALVAYVAYRLRCGRHKSAARAMTPKVVRAAQPHPGSRPAIERAPEVHVHHHWHSVSAEDVPAILRRQHEP